MALISKKKRSAELLNVKYLVFSFLFLSTVRPQIESAPTRPNKYYHKVGVDTFRFQFQFPSAKSHFHNAKKVESLGSNVNGGGIKLALRHNIHPAMMIGSTNSTKWMREMVLKNLNRDKYSANAIIAANSTDTNYPLGPSANVPLVSGNPYGANFIVNVGIGTPRKEEIKMILDTATDVSWLLCNYRNGSSSYQRLTCNSCNRQVDGMSCNGQDQCIYQNQFDTRGELEAHMSEDTLWLGSRPFPKFTFGCGYNFRKFNSDPSIGLLGLGRNSLSLPTQAASEYQGKFSYCLPAFLNPNQAGSLRLGHGSIPSTSTFTPLLSNPLARSWYFVGMTGVSVAGERVKISPDVFNFNSRGQGGTIIDSGVLFSRLVKPAYDAFRAAFVKKMGIVLMEPQPGNPLDTCFTYSQDIKTLKIPGIAFHFQNGVRLRIHKEGILTPLSPNVTCLAFRPAGMDGKSIIGSVQQQHYIFSFDEQSKQVGFASVRNCIHTDE